MQFYKCSSGSGATPSVGAGRRTMSAMPPTATELPPPRCVALAMSEPPRHAETSGTFTVGAETGNISLANGGVARDV